MDGFRADYLDRKITPNINYLGKNFPLICINNFILNIPLDLYSLVTQPQQIFLCVCALGGILVMRSSVTDSSIECLVAVACFKTSL